MVVSSYSRPLVNDSLAVFASYFKKIHVIGTFCLTFHKGDAPPPQLLAESFQWNTFRHLVLQVQIMFQHIIRSICHILWLLVHFNVHCWPVSDDHPIASMKTFQLSFMKLFTRLISKCPFTCQYEYPVKPFYKIWCDP